MAEKKKISKKSIEYVRPEPGSFDLKAFPGVEFKFRRITVDDEAWVKQTFGLYSWEIITKGRAQSQDLCRLYFHFLTDEGKAHFPPEKKEMLDYETGETKTELLNGPKKFMQAIDGGSMTEMLMIAQAFLKTLVGSRPISELPEEIKKKVLQAVDQRKSEAKEEKPIEANP